MKREGFLALTGGDVAKPQIGSLAARSELQNADDPLPPLRGGLSVTGREAWIAAPAADVPKGRASLRPACDDFCQAMGMTKSSVAISITSSGVRDNQLVATVANKVIQVCGFTFDLGGANPTAEFDYGTQTSTASDTGTTTMTGAMTATSRRMNGPLNYFTVPPGNQLCLKPLRRPQWGY
jgi:hypothetical protein